MRTLAIGDIHGAYTALDALLAAVKLSPSDRLITLGDMVDRGPDSARVLDRLIELYDAGRLFPIRGNHDEMMLASRTERTTRRMWLSYGGSQTLESYGHSSSDEFYDKVPGRHWRFLDRDCQDYLELKHHIFVHSNLEPNLALGKQPTDTLRWRRLDSPVAHCSGKVMVCGHTVQEDGLPLDWGTSICIDTGIYLFDGWLTCMHVEEKYYWQANQQGQTRQGTLEQLRELIETSS